jgi:hypothetical protein
MAAVAALLGAVPLPSLQKHLSYHAASVVRTRAALDFVRMLGVRKCLGGLYRAARVEVNFVA